MQLRTWVADDGDVYLNAADIEQWVTDLAARAHASGDGLAIIGAAGIESVAAQIADWRTKAAR